MNKHIERGRWCLGYHLMSFEFGGHVSLDHRYACLHFGPLYLIWNFEEPAP